MGNSENLIVTQNISRDTNNNSQEDMTNINFYQQYAILPFLIASIFLVVSILLKANQTNKLTNKRKEKEKVPK